MISTVFQIGVLRLWNNKQELFLALVVPILFFSIFAMIFGRGVGSGTAKIEVAIIDDDQSELTHEIARLLRKQSTIKIELDTLRTQQPVGLDGLTRAILRKTDTDVVVHLPQGFADNLRTQSSTTIQLFAEGTNPIGQQVVRALLTQVIASASATLPANQPTQVQGAPHAMSRPVMLRLPPVDAPETIELQLGHRDTIKPMEPVSYQSTDVFATDRHNPKVAMYAAGIAVMFLLFSATGAGGSLLEEHEAGTLDRLLCSRLGLTQLLAGKWLYITCQGCVQLTVMFVWAQIMFGVDLLGHIPGFAVMTLVTAAATASFALCLAVTCRTRAQLNGISIVVVLSMSALGGSMVPRYIMSEEMRRWGQLTFNAWALDGFQKVFWHDLPAAALATEVKVLLAMTVALACVASLVAERWAAT